MNRFKARTFGAVTRCLAGSTDTVIRIGFLLAVLCLFKAAMLVGFRKHLFETYWRVGSTPTDWVNLAAFFTFALVVGAMLLKLSRRYENAGTSTIRAVNVFVLTASGLFIALTFHEGERNHLHPVMSGQLGWGDLLPYYSLNLFFRSPFLAAWMAAYAVTYYCLVRTGRERLILRATAVFAFVYTALCLRDLIAYREELIVADVVGVACLLFWRRDNPVWNLFWAFLPVAFMATLFFAFRKYTDILSMPMPEFVVLVAGSLVMFLGTTLLAGQRGFHSGWLWLLTFAGVTFLLFVNANYPQAVNYRNLMCLGLTLPRYFLGEICLALALLVGTAIYRRWRPSGSLIWLDLLNVAVIGLAVVDLCLSGIMGARLDWDLLSLALGEGPRIMWRMARPYLPLAAALLIGIVAVYAFVLWGVGRFVRRQRSPISFDAANFQYALVLLLLLGVAGRWTLGSDKVIGQTFEVLVKSSPLWRSASRPVMAEDRFREEAVRLGMDRVLLATSPLSVGQHERNLNVVFVLMESAYNKHLSLFSGHRETQPLFSRYKDRMELFPNFFSSFAGSMNARFACFTGLYPLRDYKQFTLERVDVKSLFEILHEHGYSNSIFYSSYFDYTNFRDFLRGRQLDPMFDADTMPGAEKAKRVSWGLSEEVTLAAMQRQIQRYAAGKQKFFLTYVPAAPHYPYDGTPERFRKYHREKYKDFTPHFLNELLYMDWILASLLDQLKESGILDQTLVIITSDHGEMLGADGEPIGHGWAITPELANVPLIIMDPDKPGSAINGTVGSHVDLLPTILDKLRIAVPSDQLYQGVSLYSREAQSDRVAFLNSFDQYAVLQGYRLSFSSRSAQSVGTNILCKVFTISNDNARTGFREEPETVSPFSVADFDVFQENFLHNYSHYRQLLRSADTTQSSTSK
jgi:phosphoglycerol transferase MdoB-like AlkP superfamily enzyme